MKLLPLLPIFAFLTALTARGEDAPFPAPPLPELTAKVAAVPSEGLALTLTARGRSDSRAARLTALYVPAGEPPSPFLPAGAFTAHFEGAIQSPLRADCSFGADLAGTVKVSINGQEVLSGAKEAKAVTARLDGAKVRLNKGANKITIDYQSPSEGDAFFRLVWSSAEFPAEPVPPGVLTRDTAAAEVRTGERLREGRLLFAQRRCTACHDATGLVPPRGEGMPELAQDAPIFAEFGARYREAWMAHWINDPHAIRPGTLMPRVFTTGAAGEALDPRVVDVAAYLATLGTPAAAAAPAEDLAPLGGALFANLGCVACHSTPEATGEDELKRVPLGHVRAKWQPAALKEYLKDPQQFFPGTRMPNFRLSEDEATRLAAFLLAGQQKEYVLTQKGDAAKGGQLVVTAGCLNCHAGLPPMAAPKLADTLRSKWERGCLASEPAARGGAPDFAFTQEQRQALQALGSAGFASLKQDTAAEFARREVVNLRCNACHAMDATASAWSLVENDMATLQAGAPAPEGEGQPIAGPTAPPFTWFGEKLRTGWATDFIAGKTAPKPRPWLIARMPGFPAYANPLAAGLAHQHGFSAGEQPLVTVDPMKAKAGETLLSDNGGFNCTTCHGVGERPPTAVFEAPGINLALSPSRLRAEYYHRWVLFPQRIDPETKMPKFADDTGKTPLTDFFAGDAHLQYEAIWEYLQTQAKPAGGK